MSDIKRHNHLGDNFYTVPAHANQVMSQRELQETIAATGGWIMARGHMYDIVSQGQAGAYVVKLKKRQ